MICPKCNSSDFIIALNYIEINVFNNIGNIGDIIVSIAECMHCGYQLDDQEIDEILHGLTLSCK